jgi:hypothetical protein
MKVKWIIGGLLCGMLFGPSAKANPPESGNELLRGLQSCEIKDKDARDLFACGNAMGYVAGAGFILGSVGIVKGNEQVTVGQLCDVVQKYLEQNPETRDKPAGLLIWRALQKAFPPERVPERTEN